MVMWSEICPVPPRAARYRHPMYVSEETPGQTDARLREVIRRSTLLIREETYSWEELPLAAGGQLRMDALAHVRDESVWSQLVPSNGPDRELFRIFTFHFPPGVDNSGFVGWLGSLLKARFGTGIFVVCGHNSGRGGIFDHWGVGLERGEPVLAAVRALSKP
jgi:hypothetical protein